MVPDCIVFVCINFFCLKCVKWPKCAIVLLENKSIKYYDIDWIIFTILVEKQTYYEQFDQD